MNRDKIGTQTCYVHQHNLRFMFFVFARYVSELSTPVVNTFWVLVNPQPKRVDSVSCDLDNNGCGVFSLSYTSHMVVLDESDANGSCLYQCVVVCQSVGQSLPTLHLMCSTFSGLGKC